MTNKNDEILQIARERLDESATADYENRIEAEDDLRFLTGDQWPEEEKRARTAEGKPCLVINGLSQFVRDLQSGL